MKNHLTIGTVIFTAMNDPKPKTMSMANISGARSVKMGSRMGSNVGYEVRCG